MMTEAAAKRHYTVGVLVANEPGVLSRVSGLFSRRGFNIESLAVGAKVLPGRRFMFFAGEKELKDWMRTL